MTAVGKLGNPVGPCAMVASNEGWRIAGVVHDA